MWSAEPFRHGYSRVLLWWRPLAHSQLTDRGTGDAQGTLINKVTFRTLGGTGSVSLAAPAFPVSVGNLPVGTSTTLALALNVPSTVTKFSITENGTMQDDSGKVYKYSIAQIVFP